MKIISPLLLCCFKRFKTSKSAINEMKYLNVAEKHDAAKTISGFLSNGRAQRREGFSVYNKIFDFESNVRGQNSKMVMTSVSGHVLNLEFLYAYKSWHNCNPEQLFDAPIRKSCLENAEKVKRTLEREIRSCQGLIIWTDCDREGENIGFEIMDICCKIKPNITIFRAKFSEITAAGVRRAMGNLTQLDEKQSKAVDVRMELDLRTGAAITRYQTLRLQKMFPDKIKDGIISYGSCQIPTLGFVCERYKEVEAFVSEPFWKIKVTHTIDDLTVEFNWDRVRVFDKEVCEDYLMLCAMDPIAKVDNVTVKPKSKWRPTPMDTVQLEKLGSRKLKISAKTIMTIAEKLYTQGFISYPRTETNQFSSDINLRSLVEEQSSHSSWGAFASKVLEWGPNPRNGNKSDQAHPPIHPTKLATNLSGNEGRVYELIARHFLACVSKDAKGSETIVNINIAGEKFHANGLVIFERNYLDVYPYEKWNAKEIHNYEIGQTFEPTEISMEEGATSPPSLLTEADLITLMEKHGIGTDATHAEHIDKIKERGYIGEVEGKFLVPRTIGMGLYEGYESMQLELAKPQLRAQFEIDLKKICAGEKDPKIVLREQIEKYKEAYKIIIERIRQLDEKVALRLNETPQEPSNEENNGSSGRIQEVFKCPKCRTASLSLKMKKDANGYFLSCLNFPECKNAIWFPDTIREVTVLQDNCPRCGPDFRKLEIKFRQNTYLALLNAEGPTYVTCLGCDSSFRNMFHINMDSVKIIGSIVNDNNDRSSNNQIRAPQNNTRTNSRNPDTHPSTAQNTRNFSTSISARSGPGRGNTRPTVTLPDLTTRPNEQNFRVEERSTTSTNTESVNSMIELTNIVENAIDFMEDDGFDSLLGDGLDYLENEVNRNQNAPSSSEIPRNETLNRSNYTPWWPTTTTETENNNRNQSSGWNIGGHESNNSNNNQVDSIPWGTRDARNQRRHERTSMKCSKCRSVANLLTVKSGPNEGRQYYTCSKSRSCKFFEWADESDNLGFNVQLDNTICGNSSNRQVAQPGDSVLCSTCNSPTIILVTKREGPNKGRHFYKCGKPNTSCNFFKWTEENWDPNPNVAGTSGISWGSNNNSNRGQSSNSNNNRTETKKRRCGLCRNEGHTKLKCPRKAEFDPS